MPHLSTLEAAEHAYQRAMLDGNVIALDALLHDAARYVDSEGAVIDKAADLANYRSGILDITRLKELSLSMQLFGETGITRSKLRLVGTTGGEAFSLLMAYTRTWMHGPIGWVVIAAHGSRLS